MSPLCTACMTNLRMLGGIDLVGPDGHPVDAVLRQPKLLALLAYLAMPRPGTWHRRDAILAAFWPDADQGRARTSLRNALYSLRRHLEEGAIRTRGADDVSIDADKVTTDVAGMLDDLADGRPSAALARYVGELLPALHIAEAGGFEEWLDVERARVKSLARKAVAQVVDACEKSGDVQGAIDAVRRATALDPEDETAIRRLLTLLGRSGDRSQALAVYETFRARMSSEFGVAPSAETRALVSALTLREESLASVPSFSMPEGLPTLVARDGPLAEQAMLAPVSRRLEVRRTPRRWRWAAAAVLVAVSALPLLSLMRRDAALESRSLVVLPMDNETGDTNLAYVAEGLAENVARRLEGMGGIKVRSGARSDWPHSVRRDYKTIAERFGSTILLRTALTKMRDSLEVRATVMDVESGTSGLLLTRRFTTHDLRNVETELAARVAGAWFRVPLAMMPQVAETPVDPVSYALTMEGWSIQLRGISPGKRSRAKELFDSALVLDPGNARALAGLSTVFTAWTMQEVVPFEDGFTAADAASRAALRLDPEDGTALINLAMLATLRNRNFASGKALIDSAVRVDPSNAEVFLVKSVLYRFVWRWDEAIAAIRVGQQLDPLTPLYFEREALVEACRDSFPAALRLTDAQLTIAPANPIALRQRIRLLALLGRYEDAIAVWREKARLEGDDSLVNRLTRARGDSAGFWDVGHQEGRERLLALRDSRQRGSFVSPLLMIRTQIEAGEHEQGLAALTKLVNQGGDPALHRLPCQPAYDEIRGTLRFKALVAKAGPLPL